MKTNNFITTIITIIFVITQLACDNEKSAELKYIIVDVDRKILNPVLHPDETASITVTGVLQNGKTTKLKGAKIVYNIQNKLASGDTKVAELKGNQVIPKEGGMATVTAVVITKNATFTSGVDIVVRPFYREYHQTLVMKLFMGMEGEPVERLANEPLFQKKHDVICTFEEALEVIRKTDNLTRGIPKIIYLVGWQKGGHDHWYPSWSQVNPRLKRSEDSTALESLNWLIRESRKYNTTVSLHINMLDAYTHSPLWDEYVKKDLLAKDLQGNLLSTGIGIKGDEMYNVIYPREWEAGLAQRRIDELIQMIPELKEGHTIHIDVFIAQRTNGDPISPWHAKPERGGLTPDKYVETQRKIFKYWREKGFDVTGEGIFWAHPKGEGFYGLQPMAWWYPSDINYQMQTPEYLMARGRTHRENEGDFRFTSSMHGEEIYIKDKDNLPGFLGMFCRTTLPWYYLSRLERKALINDTLFYSDGVQAAKVNNHRIIRKGNFILRDDDDLFVPALWKDKEIIAFSTNGYKERKWLLPTDWGKIKMVDIYLITSDGLKLNTKGLKIVDGKLNLTLEKGMAVSIQPSAK